MIADFDGIKSVLKRLEQSDELKAYLKRHKGAYFVSAFFVSDYDKLDSALWTLEYYWPETGKVTVFMDNDGWKVNSDDNVLQKEKKVLEKLELGSVKCKDGVERAKEEIGKSHESPMKVIVILNSQDKIPLWNITVFTKSFKLLNFRIDAVSGKLKGSTVDNLFQLGK